MGEKEQKKIKMTIKNFTTILSVTSILLAQSLVSSVQPSTASEKLLAQNNDCRAVDVDSFLNVRRSPNGVIINRLEDTDIVYLDERPSNGWVKIRYPVEGYIYDQYLVYCSPDAASQTPRNEARSTTDAMQPGDENISTIPASNCRQVTQNNLSVRNQPNGQIVGQLNQDQQVMLANEGYKGWVPIEYPIDGYVSAQYLTDCETAMTNETSMNRESIATVTGSNCRQIMSPDVPVRAEPMGNIIGQLAQNEEVYIANEGYDGWVPIERPINGYVTSANLGNCTLSD